MKVELGGIWVIILCVVTPEVECGVGPKCWSH